MYDLIDPNHCEICGHATVKEDDGACDYCDTHPEASEAEQNIV